MWNMKVTTNKGDFAGYVICYAMIVTFIIRMNHQREHFIVYIFICIQYEFQKLLFVHGYS